MTSHSIQSQAQAVESLIKIIQGISKAPRAAEKEILIDRASQAVETFKSVAADIRASVGGRK